MKKNKTAFSDLLNLNAGYVAFEDKSTRFIPLAGVGLDMVHSDFWNCLSE
ncbi:MAG: hypothetical protein K9I68_05790 [Bacteroidales bacterium]|nr:hypothetical protein [Bacteroidales bacterium]MCF8338576.1 hypothetical protein [Bacteroidales bacterium]